MPVEIGFCKACGELECEDYDACEETLRRWAAEAEAEEEYENNMSFAEQAEFRAAEFSRTNWLEEGTL